jgi:hypothetical protein
MSGLQIITSNIDPLKNFKERVIIIFSLSRRTHELELLHIKFSKEVFVLLDQSLVTKVNRADISQQPAKIDVGGTTLFLSYYDGSFKLDLSWSVVTATTQASCVETVEVNKKVQEVDEKEAYFKRVRYARAQLFRMPMIFLGI